MLLRFEEIVERMTAEQPSGRILLAVSGGIDSMAMAALFLQSRWRHQVGIAHVNFSLRGEEADGDEHLVQTWSEAAGVPYFHTRFDTLTYAKEHGISIQMAARELRYRWFAELLQEQGYAWLAVAHQLDDQVETLFLNLLRGTGYRGLIGIRSQQGPIIRPLSVFTRKMIRTYVRRHGIPYREDRSNADVYYARNRLRNRVFPELEYINPSFKQTIARNMQYFSQVQEILEEQLDELRQQVVRCMSEGLEVQASVLLARPHADFWAYELLSEYGFNAAQVSALCASGQSGRYFYSGTHELVTASGVWRIYPRVEADLTSVLSFSEPGDYTLQGQVFRFGIYSKTADFKAEGAPCRLYFDADQVEWPLCCRTWRPADRFRPFGMRTGSKKLSDFFTDKKMDRHQKARQLVITTQRSTGAADDEQIVLLPGLCLDDRFRVSPQTKRIGEIFLL